MDTYNKYHTGKHNLPILDDFYSSNLNINWTSSDWGKGWMMRGIKARNVHVNFNTTAEIYLEWGLTIEKYFWAGVSEICTLTTKPIVKL